MAVEAKKEAKAEPKPKKVVHPNVVAAKERVAKAIVELKAARVAKVAAIEKFGGE